MLLQGICKSFKMISRFGLLLSSLLYLHSVNAEIIELNHFNADACRQQILASKDPFPFVMSYFDGCHYAAQLRVTVEKVSQMLPNRTFFAFDFGGSDIKNNPGLAMSNTIAIMNCLGTVSLGSPQPYLFAITNDPQYGTMIAGQLKSGGLDGNSSVQDVINFIQPPTAISKYQSA